MARATASLGLQTCINSLAERGLHGGLAHSASSYSDSSLAHSFFADPLFYGYLLTFSRNGGKSYVERRRE
jgi:hypothetical protein